MIHLNTEEFASICAVAKQAATLQGEDVIGALMKIGAFRVVQEVCITADRIERGNNMYEKMMRSKLDYEKKMLRKKK